MAKKILVRVTTPSLRGQKVAGVDGIRCYWVNPGTGMLCMLGSDGRPGQPGCHPDDARELAQFASFKVTKAAPPVPAKAKRRKRQPLPPPSPPGPGEAASASGESADGAAPDSSPAKGDSSGAPGGDEAPEDLETVALYEARAGELREMNSKQRRAIAQDLKVSGYSRMGQEALVSAIVDKELSAGA